jgi:MYXO-CTERM domain-containing protein
MAIARAVLSLACLPLALSLAAAPAAAGDMPFQGAPTSLAPLKTDAVVLASQSVEFVFDPEAVVWKVHARGELENQSAAVSGLQLGLVEYRCDPDADEESCLDPGGFRFEALEMRVRDAPLSLRKGQISSKHAWAAALGGVWLFNLRLAPHERVSVEHRYQVPPSFSRRAGASISYVTRGASLWAKPVERASFTFFIPVRSCLVVEPEGIARTSRNVVLRDGEPWLRLGYGARRWAPAEDLSLHFEVCVPARDTELAGCSLVDQLARFAYPPAETAPDAPPIARTDMKAELQKLETEELERCGRLVFDAYASYFEASELAALAKRSSAERHYTGPLLTPEDWQWVGLVDEVIAERKLKRPAPTPEQKPPSGCACSVQARPSGAGWAALSLALGFGVRRRRRQA